MASRITDDMRSEVDSLLAAHGGKAPRSARPGASPRLEARRERDAKWRWLESTKVLQEQSYGYDFATMARMPRQLCDYLAHMTMGIFSELSEVLYEFEWKRWTTDMPWFDRDRIIDECIDIQHFVGNILVAVGCSDEEYQRRYMAKQDKNRERMSTGYQQRRNRG